MRASIEMLNKLPDGMVLSAEQQKQKKAMEKQYANAIIALGRPGPDPFAALSAEIAQVGQPLEGSDAANTIPRQHGGIGAAVSRGAAGSSARRDLQPSFLGSVNDRQARGAQEDGSDGGGDV